MRPLNLLRDAAFPFARCVACGGDSALSGGLCGPCLSALEGFRLGLAQGDPAGAGRACDAAHAAFAYKGCVRSVMRAMKFEGETRPAMAHLAPVMAGMAAALGYGGYAVVPVPISRGRMLDRGYNQSALLARAVAGKAGGAREGWLWRVRETRQQTSLDRDAREANVRGAFAAHPAVRGRMILLIDDILTSGATASACAAALKTAGAARVCVLAAARAQLDGGGGGGADEGTDEGLRRQAL